MRRYSINLVRRHAHQRVERRTRFWVTRSGRTAAISSNPLATARSPPLMLPAIAQTLEMGQARVVEADAPSVQPLLESQFSAWRNSMTTS
jgi:hypothetical protein